jgi:hypothetical protein
VNQFKDADIAAQTQDGREGVAVIPSAADGTGRDVESLADAVAERRRRPIRLKVGRLTRQVQDADWAGAGGGHRGSTLAKSVSPATQRP